MQLQKKVKVLLFGFSVTEEKQGYPALLGKMLSDESIEIHIKAIGGAAISLVPFLSGHLRLQDYNYVFYEIGTCQRYSENDPEKYQESLEQIALDCRNANAFPGFINLYRDGVEYGRDQLSETIKNFASNNNFPFLDLAKYGLDAKAGGFLDVVLRDGIHTAPAGAEFYAVNIFGFIMNVIAAGRSWEDIKNFMVLGKPNRYSFVSPHETISVEPHGHFERGGIKLPFIEVMEGQHVWFDLPAGQAVQGFIFIRGPRSGLAEVSIVPYDGSKNLYYKINIYDRWCYYQRHAYWLKELPVSRRFSIKQGRAMPEVNLVKGQPEAGSRIARISGLLVRQVDG
jgi:hypothetical protein